MTDEKETTNAAPAGERGGPQAKAGADKPAPAKAAVKPEAAAAKARAGAAQAPGKAEGDLTRRDFLRIGLFGTALLFLGQIAGTFATYFWPRKVGAFGGQINLGHYSRYPAGTVTKVDAGKFYLVHHPTDGLLAIYWRCTHLG
ncbi:MAG TPA: Rieske (2Fe-2S) protein, partial [Bacillota bacterium]